MSNRQHTPAAKALNKTDLIRVLNEGLLRMSLGYSDDDAPIMAADVKSTKDGVDVICTDGNSFSLKLEMK